MKVAASETMGLDVISGNVSISGSASVGAAAAIPIVTKTTEAYVGANAEVNARGLSDVSAATGAFTLSEEDTRFRPQDAVTGNTIELGYAHGLSDGDEVVYYSGGGTPIGGLRDGRRLLRRRRLADRDRTPDQAQADRGSTASARSG